MIIEVQSGNWILGDAKDNTTAILISGIIVENLHKIIAAIFENLTFDYWGSIFKRENYVRVHLIFCVIFPILKWTKGRKLHHEWLYFCIGL